GLAVLDKDESPAAEILRREFESQLADRARPPREGQELGSYDALRARVLVAQREALLGMRATGEIGDDAFHQIEAQLDVAELTALGAG
ncbi:MAG TPA: hypothetical protein VIT67_03520, partial [Povalibacter sp.]